MHRTVSLTFFLLTLALPSPAQGYKKVYAFGDSLVDNGNYYGLTGQPGAPYWQGRMSDGPLFVEQLAASFGLALEDHALLEATTTQVFEKQVKPFILKNSGKIPSDGLYVYWAGANDLLGIFASPSSDPSKVIALAMQQTAGAVTALVQAGARSIVVVNQPDFSKVPRVLASNDPTTIAGAGLLSAAYNKALADVIKMLESSFKFDIVEVDAFQLVNDIVTSPMDHVMLNVDTPRLKANGDLREPMQRFLFMDDIHPTYAGHRLVMRSCLIALGQPIPGDANGDDLVNRWDLAALLRLRGPCPTPCGADINRDGKVDRLDYLLLVEMLEPR